MRDAVKRILLILPFLFLLTAGGPPQQQVARHNSGRNNINLTTIIVAALGALGSIASAWFGYKKVKAKRGKKDESTND